MISIWHLLWIVPLAVCAGAFCMALAVVNNSNKLSTARPGGASTG